MSGASDVKRVLDVALAAVGLVASLPLALMLAAAIRLEDGGPVFFSQLRVGRGGRLFRCWKFRSMAVGYRQGAARHGADGGDGPAPPEGVAPLQTTPVDERVTRVGRLMRRTALDELPQLWNILRGEMSFVGPRALLPREVQRGDGRPVELAGLPGFAERHSVRPGLTGLAQVRTPRDVPHARKFRYDLLYVRRRSLWLDLELIVRSFGISLRGAWGRDGRGPRVGSPTRHGLLYGRVGRERDGRLASEDAVVPCADS